MKTFKKLLCLTLAVMLCFSLIGCNFIDEMRNSQIHFNDDLNLVYNGKEYILLPVCEALSPDFSKSKEICITEKDIPVMLSKIFGEFAELSNDKKYISTSDDFGGEEIYARKDIYEGIAERINSGDYFDGYLYNYSYFDEEKFEFESFDKFISDELQVAIDSVMSGEEITDIDISLLYNFQVMDIWEASNDKLFQQFALSIYKTEKYIYLVNENERVYKVPDDKIILFEQLIKEYEILSKQNELDDIEFID